LLLFCFCFCFCFCLGLFCVFVLFLSPDTQLLVLPCLQAKAGSPTQRYAQQVLTIVAFWKQVDADKEARRLRQEELQRMMVYDTPSGGDDDDSVSDVASGDTTGDTPLGEDDDHADEEQESLADETEYSEHGSDSDGEEFEVQNGDGFAAEEPQGHNEDHDEDPGSGDGYDADAQEPDGELS